MNLNRYNIYKNAKYCMLASGIILLAGLIVGLIFGVSSEIVLGGSALLNATLAVMTFSIIVFIYTLLRYDPYTALTVVMSIVHNILLTLALTVILRIPIAENYTMQICVVTALSMINCLLLFSQVKEEQKSPLSKETTVNDITQQGIKPLLYVNIPLLIATLILSFVLETGVLSFVRPMLIGIIVSVYSAIFMSVTFWGYFVKEKKKRKPETLEENLVK